MANRQEELLFIPVPGYEGYYEVSETGLVRSLGFHTVRGYRKGKVLSASLMSTGYLSVCLVKDGTKKTHAVHVLVCTAFHGPKPEGMTAAHKDGMRLHNHKDNLRWSTWEDQAADRRDHGTIAKGDGHGQTKIPDALIPVIKAEYVKGSPTHGLKALAAKYGVSIPPIYRIVTGARV